MPGWRESASAPARSESRCRRDHRGADPFEDPPVGDHEVRARGLPRRRCRSRRPRTRAAGQPKQRVDVAAALVGRQQHGAARQRLVGLFGLGRRPDRDHDRVAVASVPLIITLGSEKYARRPADVAAAQRVRPASDHGDRRAARPRSRSGRASAPPSRPAGSWAAAATAPSAPAPPGRGARSCCRKPWSTRIRPGTPPPRPQSTRPSARGRSHDNRRPRAKRGPKDYAISSSPSSDSPPALPAYDGVVEPYVSSIARVSFSIASVTSSRSGLRSSASRIAGDLAREELGIGERAGVHLAVALGLGLVPVGLSVLRQQDQRRRVRGLGREREVKQDERVRIPPQRSPRSG